MNGAILIGAAEHQSAAKFHATDPSTGVRRQQPFSEASPHDVAEACALAEAAFPIFAALDLERRAAFLEAIGAAIAAIGDALIETAMAETGLPRGRLEGERARTINQLRLFAEVLRQGDWLEATLDRALPERAPPRPDLRRMNAPLGPVAVFGASNFPLAFSVAGGDTASAFAAGCPVVVKGHRGHPGTGELVARAVRDAVEACRLPEGVFSYLPGTTHDLGHALVADPRIKAVGFTGSRTGGQALMGVAQARPEPIPVYAEMSSINPVILLPAALAARAETLAQGFVQSLTLGAGQFCTNPGLVFALDGPDLDRFVAAASATLAEAPAAVMLTPGIRASFNEGVDALAQHPAVSVAGRGLACGDANQASGALFLTDAAAWRDHPDLSREVFGASSVVVRCRDLDELKGLVVGLDGQLTITVHLETADHEAAAQLSPLLARKAGRVLMAGWPTGVEVTHAMVHGGPYPATSDGRSTSVGSAAIQRFLRPVCFQDVPDALLPPPLQAANPWGLRRRVDGQWEGLQ